MAGEGSAGFSLRSQSQPLLTHTKKLVDCEEQLADFVALAKRLGPSLGPILYQLPPSLHKDLPRLAAFLEQLPGEIEHVVEFRHTSWYDEAVLALLDAHGAGFVTHDLKGLESPPWASGRTAYVRFHGTGEKYWGRYEEEQIKDWAAWLIEQSALGRSCWAFFNNDIHGHAIEDARALASMVDHISR